MIWFIINLILVGKEKSDSIDLIIIKVFIWFFFKKIFNFNMVCKYCLENEICCEYSWEFLIFLFK